MPQCFKNESWKVEQGIISPVSKLHLVLGFILFNTIVLLAYFYATMVNYVSLELDLTYMIILLFFLVPLSTTWTIQRLSSHGSDVWARGIVVLTCTYTSMAMMSLLVFTMMTIPMQGKFIVQMYELCEDYCSESVRQELTTIDKPGLPDPAGDSI